MALGTGMRSWAKGKVRGNPGVGRDIRAHVSTPVLTENMAASLGHYLPLIFCGNPRLHDNTKQVSQVLT